METFSEMLEKLMPGASDNPDRIITTTGEKTRNYYVCPSCGPHQGLVLRIRFSSASKRELAPGMYICAWREIGRRDRMCVSADFKSNFAYTFGSPYYSPRNYRGQISRTDMGMDPLTQHVSRLKNVRACPTDLWVEPRWVGLNGISDNRIFNPSCYYEYTIDGSTRASFYYSKILYDCTEKDHDVVV